MAYDAAPAELSPFAKALLQAKPSAPAPERPQPTHVRTYDNVTGSWVMRPMSWFGPNAVRGDR